jgi:TPR repeat protein
MSNRFAVIAFVAGCSSPSPISAPPPIANQARLDCGDMRCVDLARAYELGAGRPRDYRAAAEAYRIGCELGDAIACRRLGFAMLNGVGVARNAPSGRPFDKACQLGDIVACSVTAGFAAMHCMGDVSGGTEQEMRELGARCRREAHVDSIAVKLNAACRAGSIDACEHAECEECRCDKSGCARALQHDRELCHKGSVATCASVVSLLCQQNYTTCVAEMQASPENRGVIADAIAACDAGDANVCAVIPGREIPLEQLCAAHDERACERLASQRH